MGLSIRGYARHRGVSEAAVRKAISAGRIAKKADGTIDPDKADAAWQARSDPARGRPTALKQKPVPRAAIESVRETLAESGTPVPGSGAMTYLQARTANEVVKVQTARLRLQRLKGELVDRARAATQVFALARAERDAWLGWPTRVAALMAAELGSDSHTVQTLLERHVRQHLEGLSEIDVDIG